MMVLSQGRSFGYIVANKWLRASYAVPLRKWLKGQQVQQLIDFGDLQVFKGVAAYPCILIIEKAPATTGFHATKVESLESLDLMTLFRESSFECFS